MGCLDLHIKIQLVCPYDRDPLNALYSYLSSIFMLTSKSSFRTMELFRKYCIGPGAVNFRILSDPLKTFVTPEEYARPQCLCFNLIVFHACRCGPGSRLRTLRIRTTTWTCPCFPYTAITTTPAARAHDRCVYEHYVSISNQSFARTNLCLQSLSALDLLSVANLVNYFGKCERVRQPTCVFEMIVYLSYRLHSTSGRRRGCGPHPHAEGYHEGTVPRCCIPV